MSGSKEFSIVWTKYMKYRAKVRGFDLGKITERYFDTITQRMVVVGRHDDKLVLIPYEEKDNEITPITI